MSPSNPNTNIKSMPLQAVLRLSLDKVALEGGREGITLRQLFQKLGVIGDKEETHDIALAKTLLRCLKIYASSGKVILKCNDESGDGNPSTTVESIERELDNRVIATESARFRALGIPGPKHVPATPDSYRLLEYVASAGRKGFTKQDIEAVGLNSRKSANDLDKLIFAGLVVKKHVVKKPPSEQKQSKAVKSSGRNLIFNVYVLKRFSDCIENEHVSEIDDGETWKKEGSELLVKEIEERGGGPLVFIDACRYAGITKKQMRNSLHRLLLQGQSPVELYLAQCQRVSSSTQREMWCVRLRGQKKGLTEAPLGMYRDLSFDDQVLLMIKDSHPEGITVPLISKKLKQKTKIVANVCAMFVKAQFVKSQKYSDGRNHTYRLFYAYHPQDQVDLSSNKVPCTENNGTFGAQNKEGQQGISGMLDDPARNPHTSSPTRSTLKQSVSPTTLFSPTRLTSVKSNRTVFKLGVANNVSTTVIQRRKMVLDLLKSRRVLPMFQIHSAIKEKEIHTESQICRKSVRRIMNHLKEIRAVTEVCAAVPPGIKKLGQGPVTLFLLPCDHPAQEIHRFFEGIREKELQAEKEKKERENKKKPSQRDQPPQDKSLASTGVVKAREAMSRFGYLGHLFNAAQAFHTCLWEYVCSSAENMQRQIGDEAHVEMSRFLSSMEVKQYLKILGPLKKAPDILKHEGVATLHGVIQKKGIVSDLPKYIQTAFISQENFQKRLKKMLSMMKDLKLIVPIRETVMDLFEKGTDFLDNPPVVFDAIDFGSYKLNMVVRIDTQKGPGAAAHKIIPVFEWKLSAEFMLEAYWNMLKLLAQNHFEEKKEQESPLLLSPTVLEKIPEIKNFVDWGMKKPQPDSPKVQHKSAKKCNKSTSANSKSSHANRLVSRQSVKMNLKDKVADKEKTAEWSAERVERFKIEYYRQMLRAQEMVNSKVPRITTRHTLAGINYAKLARAMGKCTFESARTRTRQGISDKTILPWHYETEIPEKYRAILAKEDNTPQDEAFDATMIQPSAEEKFHTDRFTLHEIMALNYLKCFYLNEAIKSREEDPEEWEKGLMIPFGHLLSKFPSSLLEKMLNVSWSKQGIVKLALWSKDLAMVIAAEVVRVKGLLACKMEPAFTLSMPMESVLFEETSRYPTNWPKCLYEDAEILRRTMRTGQSMPIGEIFQNDGYTAQLLFALCNGSSNIHIEVNQKTGNTTNLGKRPPMKKQKVNNGERELYPDELGAAVLRNGKTSSFFYAHKTPHHVDESAGVVKKIMEIVDNAGECGISYEDLIERLYQGKISAILGIKHALKCLVKLHTVIEVCGFSSLLYISPKHSMKDFWILPLGDPKDHDKYGPLHPWTSLQDGKPLAKYTVNMARYLIGLVLEFPKISLNQLMLTQRRASKAEIQWTMDMLEENKVVVCQYEKTVPNDFHTMARKRTKIKQIQSTFSIHYEATFDHMGRLADMEMREPT